MPIELRIGVTTVKLARPKPDRSCIAATLFTGFSICSILPRLYQNIQQENPFKILGNKDRQAVLMPLKLLINSVYNFNVSFLLKNPFFIFKDLQTQNNFRYDQDYNI
jgi:hypothetical protein